MALSWIKPDPGYCKLNVDGTRTRVGDIGAGGVIRDESGTWLGGFMANVGCGEVLQAEAWGLYYGLQLAANLHISKLVIESDSAVLVNLMHGENFELHPLASIIRNCKDIMMSFEQVQLLHIHRERNSVADLLAKNSPSNALGICTLHEPPSFVTETLLDDIVGMSRSRLVRTGVAG